MRKFTKEISMLIAAVTAGSMSGATVNAVTEADAAKAVEPEYKMAAAPGMTIPDENLDNCEDCEDLLPTVGEEAPPDYTEPEGTPIKMAGEATVPDYTEPEENVMQMQGQATVPDYTEPEQEWESMVGDVAPPDYTESEKEPEPLMGDVAIPDYTEPEKEPEPVMGGFPTPDYTKQEVTLPPEDGVATLPDYTEPDETLPPEEGEAMPPDFTEPEDILMPTTGVMPAINPGDANEDGIFDVTDLTQFSLYLLGDTKMTYSGELNADMDGDGELTLADLATMKQKLSKKDNNQK
jgi:hypothetical protein